MTGGREVFRLVLRVQPMAWKRARRNRERYFTEPAMASYQRLVQVEAMRQLGQRDLQGALQARMVFGLAIPKSWRLRRIRDALDGLVPHSDKPDADNLAKMVLDALQGGLYYDDAHFCGIEVHKVWSLKPFVLIEIWQVAEQKNILQEALAICESSDA